MGVIRFLDGSWGPSPEFTASNRRGIGTSQRISAFSALLRSAPICCLSGNSGQNAPYRCASDLQTASGFGVADAGAKEFLDGDSVCGLPLAFQSVTQAWPQSILFGHTDSAYL